MLKISLTEIGEGISLSEGLEIVDSFTICDCWPQQDFKLGLCNTWFCKRLQINAATIAVGMQSQKPRKPWCCSCNYGCELFFKTLDSIRRQLTIATMQMQPQNETLIYSNYVNYLVNRVIFSCIDCCCHWLNWSKWTILLAC